MTPASKIALGFSGLAGGSGMGVGGLYLSSKEDILSKVKDDVLGTETEFNSSWKSQFKKLSTENRKIPKDLEKLKSITEENQQISAIKGWCSSVYTTTYKSIFSSKKEELLDVVRKYCIQSLKEKLTDSITESSKVLSVTDETDKQEFINNYKKLKDHNSTQDGKLDSTLSAFDATKAESESQTKWSSLRDWCKESLTKSFKGESDDLFKTSKKFCVKQA
ncbi:hypothetical protein MHF_0192 [Mycoplasma haemofelis Ohio2]|uniref:Uncharacterized protein n=1 Tax=Mycoplasma haemofelis (strain Ohio2) TaxID=859194 RepID=F6FG25_MYCHI|nr:hypothetical protein MHF_0192 [Mycoplasma haemofelis Ohio2]